MDAGTLNELPVAASGRPLRTRIKRVQTTENANTEATKGARVSKAKPSKRNKMKESHTLQCFFKAAASAPAHESVELVTQGDEMRAAQEDPSAASTARKV
jgi:hypothetical protein